MPEKRSNVTLDHAVLGEVGSFSLHAQLLVVAELKREDEVACLDG